MVTKRCVVPEEYNYLAAFLTLRCNLGCSYCINGKSGGVLRHREELTSEQWIDGLNGLELKPDLPVTLEGGEPTMHPGFYDIANGVRHPIDILTNLQFDISEFTKRISPEKLNKRGIVGYKSIRASFHSEKMDAEDTIARAKELQDAGFAVGLFSLNIPESTEENMRMAELARQNRIYFFIKDFLGFRDGRLFGHFKYPEGLDGKRKSCGCRITDLLIAPDAEIYKCHRDMYHAEFPLGRLIDEELAIEHRFRQCDNYGTCNPCDLKLKTNRYLQMGSCSVEITPRKKKQKS